jgi:hypothetical protein
MIDGFFRAWWKKKSDQVRNDYADLAGLDIKPGLRSPRTEYGGRKKAAATVGMTVIRDGRDFRSGTD